MLQALLEAPFNFVLVMFTHLVCQLYSFLCAQDYCFSNIFGAPTAAHVSSRHEASDTAAGRLGRRVSGLARRASAAALSVTGPIISSQSTRGASAGSTILARVKSVFFEDATMRAIPEAVESSRALAGISMSIIGTLGTNRESSFGVDGSNSGVYGHKQSSLDIESGVSSSHRLSTNMQRRSRTVFSTGSVSILPTVRRSQVMSFAPSHDFAEVAPFPTEWEIDLDPAKLYERLENDLQQFLPTLETDADRNISMKQWGYVSFLF
jgi:hypothetical protein